MSICHCGQCRRSAAHCGWTATMPQERVTWSPYLSWWRLSQARCAEIQSESKPRHQVEEQPGRPGTPSCRKMSLCYHTSMNLKKMLLFKVLLFFPPVIMLHLGLLVSMTIRRTSNVRIMKWSWHAHQISVRVSFHKWWRIARKHLKLN